MTVPSREPENDSILPPVWARPEAPAEDRDFRFGTLPAILLVAMLASITVWGIADRQAGGNQLWQTGIYFIVIPGTMAVLMAMIRPTSGAMSVSQGTTIAILASAIVVREGFICVLLALPLIIPVVAIVAWAVRRTNDHRAGPRLAAVPLLLLAMSGEGVAYELPTGATASEQRVMPVSAHQVDRSLAQPAELPSIEPLLFALPFPKPTSVEGISAAIGDRAVVSFDSGGAMTLQVTERQSNQIQWTIVENSTPVAGWMTLHTVTASWTEVDGGVLLDVAIEFDRELNPAVYFDPLERWGVGELAEVFADMLEHNAARVDVAS